MVTFVEKLHFAGGFPFRAFGKVGVIEVLHFAQAFGWLFALRDPGEFAEIFEALDAGSDDDQQIGATTLCGREGVRQFWRHDDYVTAFSLDDLIAGEDLHHAIEHVKHFRGVSVVVRLCSVCALVQRDLYCG